MVHGRAFQCVLLFAVAGFFLLLLADWQGAYSFVCAYRNSVNSIGVEMSWLETENPTRKQLKLNRFAEESPEVQLLSQLL